MLGNQLSAFELDAIEKDLRDSFGPVGTDAVDHLIHWIDLILEKWKLEYGSRQPTSAGLLGRPIELGSALPRQCSDVSHVSNSGFAYWLSAAGYEPMCSAFDKVPHVILLAALALTETRLGIYNSRAIRHAYMNFRDFREQMAIAEVSLLEPLAISGAKFSAEQRKRAGKARSPISEDGCTIASVVGDIARRPENKELSAKELWPELFSALDRMGADPTEISGKNSDPAYHYVTYRGKMRSVSFGHFKNLLKKKSE